MHIVKRIMKKLKAKRSHVDVAEVQALAGNLRDDFLKKEDILKFLGSENFSSLVDVAKCRFWGIYSDTSRLLHGI